MKNLKISPEVHKALKVYCSEHSLKMNSLADKILLEYIKEKTDGNKKVQ